MAIIGREKEIKEQKRLEAIHYYQKRKQQVTTSY